MVRTTERTVHPKYQEFLDQACGHIAESTLRTYTAMLRVLPSPAKLTTTWFKRRMKEVSPYTAEQIRLIIKMFLKWNGDNIDEWKDLKLPTKKDSVTVEDLYTRDELQAIFSACLETRDRAMLMVLYESAARLSELLSMDFDKIKFEEETSSTTVTGKTGTRTVYLKDSVPALIAWMNVHPTKEGPLWTTINSPVRPLKASGLTTRVAGIMKRVDLGRPTKKTIHMFRHTRITELVRLGISGMSLKKIVGWTKGSNMEAVYVHLSTHDIENEVKSKVFGQKVRPQQPMLVSGKCPRCGVMVDVNDVVCSKCSLPLSGDALVQELEKRQAQDDRIMVLTRKTTGLEESVHLLAKIIHDGLDGDEEGQAVFEPFLKKKKSKKKS